MTSYIPTTGYVVVRAVVTWPRGGEATVTCETVGEVIAVDPERPAAIYLGAGRCGSANGTWMIDADVTAVTARALLVVRDDASETETVWKRLSEALLERGVHELVGTA